MQKAEIRSIIKRKFRITTDSEHKYATVENKLERNFKPGITGSAMDIRHHLRQNGERLALSDHRD